MGEKDKLEDILLKVELKNPDMKKDVNSTGVCSDLETMAEVYVSCTCLSGPDVLRKSEMLPFREFKEFLSNRTDVMVLDRLFVTCFDVELEKMAVIKCLDKFIAPSGVSEGTVSIL